MIEALKRLGVGLAVLGIGGLVIWATVTFPLFGNIVLGLVITFLVLLIAWMIGSMFFANDGGDPDGRYR